MKIPASFIGQDVGVEKLPGPRMPTGAQTNPFIELGAGAAQIGVEHRAAALRQDVVDKAEGARSAALIAEQGKAIIQKNASEIRDAGEFETTTSRQLRELYSEATKGAGALASYARRDLELHGLTSQRTIAAFKVIKQKDQATRAVEDSLTSYSRLSIAADSELERVDAHGAFGNMVDHLESKGLLDANHAGDYVRRFTETVQKGRTARFGTAIKQELDTMVNAATNGNRPVGDLFQQGNARIDSFTDISLEQRELVKSHFKDALYTGAIEGRIEREPFKTDEELRSGMYNSLIDTQSLRQLKAKSSSEIQRLIRQQEALRVEQERALGELTRDRSQAFANRQPWRPPQGVSEAEVEKLVQGTKHAREWNNDTRNFAVLYGAAQNPPFTTAPENSGLPATQRFFKTAFGRDLPVSARGQTLTHDQLGLDHRGGVDIAVSPASKEGAALIEYFKKENIPFRAFEKADPGAATGPHIHMGAPSPRLSQRDVIDQLRNNPDGSPRAMSGDDALLVKKLQGVLDDTVAGLKKDPLQYGIDARIVNDPGPFNLNDPASMAAHERAARMSERHWGVRVAPVRDGDAEQLKEQYEKASLQGKADILAGLASGFSDDMHARVGKIVAPKSTAMAMHMELAKRRGIQTGVLKDVLRGGELMKVEKSTVFAKPTEDINTINQTLDKYAQQAYRGAPVYYDALKKATVDYLAAKRWDSGDRSIVSSTGARQAFDKVSGGVLSVRGVPTVSPVVGGSEADFLDRLRRADYFELSKGFKPEDIINRHDAKFEYIQEGRYHVMVNGAPIANQRGQPFIIDLISVSPPWWGKDEQSLSDWSAPRPDLRRAELERLRAEKLRTR